MSSETSSSLLSTLPSTLTSAIELIGSLPQSSRVTKIYKNTKIPLENELVKKYLPQLKQVIKSDDKDKMIEFIKTIEDNGDSREVLYEVCIPIVAAFQMTLFTVTDNIYANWDLLCICYALGKYNITNYLIEEFGYNFSMHNYSCFKLLLQTNDQMAVTLYKEMIKKDPYSFDWDVNNGDLFITLIGCCELPIIMEINPPMYYFRKHINMNTGWILINTGDIKTFKYCLHCGIDITELAAPILDDILNSIVQERSKAVFEDYTVAIINSGVNLISSTRFIYNILYHFRSKKIITAIYRRLLKRDGTIQFDSSMVTGHIAMPQELKNYAKEMNAKYVKKICKVKKVVKKDNVTIMSVALENKKAKK